MMVTSGFLRNTQMRTQQKPVRYAFEVSGVESPDSRQIMTMMAAKKMIIMIAEMANSATLL